MFDGMPKIQVPDSNKNFLLMVLKCGMNEKLGSFQILKFYRQKWQDLSCEAILKIFFCNFFSKFWTSPKSFPDSISKVRGPGY